MLPMLRKRSIVSEAKLACLVVLALALVLPADLHADWKSDWEKVLAEAKKEGQLNLYVGRYGQAQILDEFKKDYPWIKLVTLNGTGNGLATRVLAEVRAGKPLADLFSGGANSNYTLLYKGKVLQSFKPTLILPEVADETKWLGGKHVYTDDEQEYIFVYIANTGGGSVFYNEKQVDPKEFKSYWDLLNPRWKGKITSQPLNETGLGATLQFYYYNPELGPEWIRRLYTEMDVTMGDRRLIVDWLATGKYPLCIGCRGVDKARAQGLPVGEFDERMWKEGQGLTTGGGSISFVKGAPHPNAAKVFINWFLSRKGQILLQSSPDLYGDLAPNSRRTDIPKDMLPPQNRLIEGRKYLDIARPEYADLSPIFKLAKEVMAARERR